MRTIRNSTFTFIGLVLLSTMACKKDTKGPSVPELTTLTVTSIAANTATSGGTIVSNGGETIAYSGVCWSKNPNPTVNDDTTKGSTGSGSFTALMANLTPSTTYYVRAYAINRVGTGYGNEVTFSSGNAAPVASAVTVTGTAEVNRTLTATYIYTDAEADAQSGSTFQWYVANDAAGAGEVTIAGATTLTYLIQPAEQGKYIRFGITPKAATGTSPGTEVKSTFIGAVGEATTVTFIYNGVSVTYGIINSPNGTGKKWLDRNLGATRLAQTVDDYLAYGDMFQWGRLADGHQLVNRTGPNDADVTGLTGTTSPTPPYETSSTDIPTTNKFILNSAANVGGDWRVPQNSNLWQGVNGINNPCPTGWRIPTKAEWIAENITKLDDGFAKLKLTRTGRRSTSTGTVSISTLGAYWTSTSEELTPGGPFGAGLIGLTATSISPNKTNRGMGQACRCIKD